MEITFYLNLDFLVTLLINIIMINALKNKFSILNCIIIGSLMSLAIVMIYGNKSWIDLVISSIIMIILSYIVYKKGENK